MFAFLKSIFKSGDGAQTRNRPDDKSKQPRYDFTEIIDNNVFKQYTTNIAGITYFNEDGSSRNKITKSCKYGQKLLLVHDPENVYDKNAVKVTTDSGLQLGFLNSLEAKNMQPILKGTGRSYGHAEVYFVETGTFVNEEDEIMPYCRICIRKYYKSKSPKIE